jgi:hypothetical protein
MAVRVPLPNRRQLQTLTGLIQAIKYHLNVASNTIITDDSALGYINAAEDIDLTPLKTISMKKSEFITPDSADGTFHMENLQYPVTEVIGLFYRYDNQFTQDEWLEYVSPEVFGKAYGSIQSVPLYTIKTATDGSNNQLICVRPASTSAKLGIDYYSDWPKLGDLTSGSLLQQIKLAATGTATQAGTISIKSTVSGVDTSAATIPVAIGDTADTVMAAIAARGVPFQALAGNNTTQWVISTDEAGDMILTAADYIGVDATLTITGVPSGITVTQSPVQSCFVQTVQTNWFLWQFPYVYYYAALKHAYSGLDDLERYQLVEKEFIKASQVLQSFNDRAEWGGASSHSNYNQNVIW